MEIIIAFNKMQMVCQKKVGIEIAVSLQYDILLYGMIVYLRL